ncbi:MAG TPA: hypothetical protein VGG36_08545 [Rhizomicrobium sp.]
MWGISAAWRSSALFGLAALVSVGLSGCGDIDDALFGGPSSAPEAGAAPEAAAPGAPAGDNGEAAAAPGNEAGTLPSQNPAASSAAPSAIGVQPVQIEPGSDTGTTVSHSVAELRNAVSALEDRLVADSSHLAELKGQAAQSASDYHEAKAHITTHLQLGTTRGNPQLVAEWNNGQTALDTLTANINAMNALGIEIANDSSRAHYTLSTIEATFNVSGAVDEDHRQLHVLQDETEQTIVLIDRVMMDVSNAVQRQTAFVANERANLATLAAAIKNGELYGAELGSGMTMPMASPPGYGELPSGAPLVNIRFDRAHVDYQQTLYTALAQALQSRPGASFDIVAVSPTRGSASAVQLAQTEAQRHASDVLRSMTDMGVPGNRLGISSTTDPSVSSTEVRVYVR